MSSFTLMMLEDGVEVELPTDLSEIIKILDTEVPHFACEGHGYTVTAGKGTLGKKWELVIKSFDHAHQAVSQSLIGLVELEKIEAGLVRLRIPPRVEQAISTADEFDRDGKYFGSFIYQTLNTLQRHKLLRLPGVLPTV